MDNPSLKISKTDAAKRQLETAIRLWVNDGEPVSIHTLAAASLQILNDLGEPKGTVTILRNLALVKPEMRGRFRKMIVRYQNFFKHADNDPDALLEFNPQATELYIMDAVMAYGTLTKEFPHIFTTYRAWFFLTYPELLAEEFRKGAQEFSSRGDLLGLGKQQFFKLNMELFFSKEMI